MAKLTFQSISLPTTLVQIKISQFAMTFSTGMNVPRVINPADFGDPITFLPVPQTRQILTSTSEISLQIHVGLAQMFCTDAHSVWCTHSSSSS